MGRTKRDQAEAKRPEYQPIEWRQVSGFSVEDDALDCVSLSSAVRRRNEIKRLAHFHGHHYAKAVEARVRQLFGEADIIKKFGLSGQTVF